MHQPARRRIIVAENIEFVAKAERGFDCDLDQVSRLVARLSGAAARIGAGDVEVAQENLAAPTSAARGRSSTTSKLPEASK
jgi:hypothetical protein